MSAKETRYAFAQGWAVESIEPSLYEVQPDPKVKSFSLGGPKGWLVVVQRA